MGLEMGCCERTHEDEWQMAFGCVLDTRIHK